MLNRKRILVSLGGGILVFVVGLFSILLVWRLLNSPARMTMAIIWMLVWPIRLLLLMVSIPYPEKWGVVLALLVGVVADVAILSGLIYFALSRFSGRSPRSSPSPPPPPPSYP